MKPLLWGFFLALIVSPALAQTERDYQRKLCAGWQLEYKLPNGNRVDCLSGLHAIEVDWLDKYHEAIGQSLDYAAQTGLTPGIILICRQADKHCYRHAQIAEETVKYHLLPIDLWVCRKDDALLSDCQLIGPNEAIAQRCNCSIGGHDDGSFWNHVRKWRDFLADALW